MIDERASLELVQLTRRFGDVVAVDGVGFRVDPGELVGFVGGNGAGKTTTMRLVMGVAEPDAGQVLWAGRPATAAVRARFGYMPEERGLYPKQKVIDQLVYLARLHGLDAAAARAGALTHLERFGLADRAGARLETLSLGNQQRVQITAAVMAHPLALLLDEPFSGLDPDAVDAMVGLLREHTAAGVPVLFSSHQLDLVERLCDRVVVLSRGRVVADGTPTALRRTPTTRYRLVTDADAGWVREWALRARGVHVLDVDGGTAVIEPNDPQVLNPLLAEALSRATVTELSPVRPTLAEIYHEVTR